VGDVETWKRSVLCPLLELAHWQVKEWVENDNQVGG
jgi:hypothetical protein